MIFTMDPGPESQTPKGGPASPTAQELSLLVKQRERLARTTADLVEIGAKCREESLRDGKAGAKDCIRKEDIHMWLFAVLQVSLDVDAASQSREAWRA